jgi:hypothetical protein
MFSSTYHGLPTINIIAIILVVVITIVVVVVVVKFMLMFVSLKKCGIG